MRFVILILAVFPVLAQAYPIEVLVDAKANGGFGPVLGGSGLEPDPTITEMVNAVELTAGATIVVVADGAVFIADSESTDANGLTALAPSPYVYVPLEEAAVDSGALTIPREDLVVASFGALMGAFIDASTVNADGFLALNDDPDPDFDNLPLPIPDPIRVGGISAQDLFLIGAGPFSFTAPSDGSLFLGVNDMYVGNNSGAFSVSIQVPLPGTVGLLLIALTVLGIRRSRGGNKSAQTG